MRNIAVGADHGGFELKERIKEHLVSRGYEVCDCGTNSPEPVDYPVIAGKVARRVASGASSLGIIVDGAGIGSSMVANKVPGVRAALCYDVSSARNCREHNDANVLTLGARLIGPDLAIQIVDVFLDTECTAERHLRRVAMIEQAGREDTGIETPWLPASGRTDGGEKVVTKSEGSGAELSEADLRRVADRIAELMGSGAVVSSDGTCTSTTCGFCSTGEAINADQVRNLLSAGADRIVYRGDGGQVPDDVAKYIDHTVLKPDTDEEQIVKLCKEAADHGFASVCVNPYWVKKCADLLRGSSVKVCTVVGFPLGANVSETKALEARRAIREGAKEIDMVINVGALKSGDDETVYKDIRRVVEACIDGGALCKVIIETALLTNDEKVRACKAARRARAEFVKTSTGFGPGGATAEDVALMSEVVKDARMGVKASGGIRSYEDAEKMIKAGATRIGASAGVRIVKESKGVTVSDGGGDKY